ncbi:hypothetical protein [Paenibacillus odorifer]|uniref:hypothetical protein n=1 Tax=Paenibacillus odorifer TaxID=189426 RepID=UPI0011154D7C|nr:hypothetical protein [Paenibacillus odorifer]
MYIVDVDVGDDVVVVDVGDDVVVDVDVGDDVVVDVDGDVGDVDVGDDVVVVVVDGDVGDVDVDAGETESKSASLNTKQRFSNYEENRCLVVFLIINK